MFLSITTKLNILLEYALILDAFAVAMIALTFMYMFFNILEINKERQEMLSAALKKLSLVLIILGIIYIFVP